MSNSPYNLLLVSAEESLGYAIMRIFPLPQFRVWEAGTIPYGRQLALSEKPDLVLLDDPGKDYSVGEILSFIHRIDEVCPVLLVSSGGIPWLEREALAAGAFAHIRKPMELGVLRELVNSALESRSSGRDKDALPGNTAGAGQSPSSDLPPERSSRRGRNSAAPVLDSPGDRAAVDDLAPDDVFDALFKEIGRRQPLPDGYDSFDVIEKHLITRTLDACQGNQSRAARFLGITRNTLRKRIRKYGIASLEDGEGDE